MTRETNEKVYLTGDISLGPVSPREHQRRFTRTALYASLALNVVLMLVLCGYRYRSEPSQLSPYARLGQRREPWSFTTPYGPVGLTDRTEADRLWDLEPSNSEVVLPEALVKEWRLPASRPSDRQSGHRLYHVSEPYSMNCLKKVRQAVLQTSLRETDVMDAEEISHCLDVLRQDVRCLADDTLIYISSHEGTYPGEGQSRVCRDRRRLEQWTAALHST